jgi:WhiB family redox-sensing transcriptional regulator
MREPRFYEAPSCSTVGGDFWFPDNDLGIVGASTVDGIFAKSICNGCPHRRECSEWGIQNETHGIWGGLTPRDRQRIRRERGIKVNQEEDVA